MQPPVTPLTRATSAEIGLASEHRSPLADDGRCFLLKLKSELVFDGDAGVTSPSGATTRTGIELGNTYQINSWLHANLNAAFSRARFDQDAPPDDLGCAQMRRPAIPAPRPSRIIGRYVPNSPTNVIDAGLTAQRESGLVRRHQGAALRRVAAGRGQQREVARLHDHGHADRLSKAGAMAGRHRRLQCRRT